MLAIDTETCLIEPGLLAPPLVCLTWADANDSGLLATDRDKPLDFMGLAFLSRQPIVGHNIAYDMAVLCSEYPELIPVIFKAYEEGRIHDTGIRQFLINVAIGVHTKATKYSLKALCKQHLDTEIDKDETRVTFAQYRGKPIEDYSEKHKNYAIEDAQWTYDVWNFQEAHSDLLRDEAAQCRAAFALHLCACWGMVTDQVAVDALEASLDATISKLSAEMVRVGFQRADGSMDTRAAQAHMACVERFYPGFRDPGFTKQLPLRGLNKADREYSVSAVNDCLDAAFENSIGPFPKLTDGGEAALAARKPIGIKHLSLDSDACERSRDELLIKRQEYTSTKAVKNKDIPMFREPLITTRFGNAETGRTTSSKPDLVPGGNFQNLARRQGIRECIVPRPGMVFAAADYGGAELHTLAQVCINMGLPSQLATELNRGTDVHKLTASMLLGCDIAEVSKEHRQMAKAANFGFPGGLGAATFIDFARDSYGVRVTEAEAKELKAAWLQAYPEMVEYFKIISRITDQPEPQIEHFGSRRLRGGVSYCQAANSYFQGMAADGAKAAVWEVQKACYTDTGREGLRGCRMVGFYHDEIMVEVPYDDRAAWRAETLGAIMVSEFNHFTPDVPVSAEPLLMRRWSKNAEPTFENGRLVPWEPS